MVTMKAETLAYARRLKEAGASEALAEEIAAGGPEGDTSALATKSDLAELKVQIADLRADLFRPLWILGGGIVALVVAFDRLFPGG